MTACYECGVTPTYRGLTAYKIDRAKRQLSDWWRYTILGRERPKPDPRFNFVGELFGLTPSDTPFLRNIGATSSDGPITFSWGEP